MFHHYGKPKVIPDFLTEDEIEYIKQASINKFRPSLIGKGNVNPNIRNSETVMLKLEDPIVKRVAKRCTDLINKPVINCEKLNVTRYREGGYYTHHQDANDLNQNNIRLYTFIIALNDDYEGGETIFPLLNKSYKLSKGDAIFFHTVDTY